MINTAYNLRRCSEFNVLSKFESASNKARKSCCRLSVVWYGSEIKQRVTNKYLLVYGDE
jgi:hypothetical protein